MANSEKTASSLKIPSRPRGLRYKATHMLIKKRPTGSTIKNFFLAIYLLYFRYSVETGVVSLTYPEAIFVNCIFGFLLFSLCNQGSRLIFSMCVWLYRFITCMFWAYEHADKL